MRHFELSEPKTIREACALLGDNPDARAIAGGTALLTMIKMPEDPTNCTFGGKDRKTLYVTTISSLYKIQTAVTGQAGPPGK